jgi:sugar phosphate isomerase/epimerase
VTTDLRLGFSSYSFHRLLSTGDLSLREVIDWIADSGGEHLELAVLSDDADSPVPSIGWDGADVDAIREHAASAGVVLSSLAVGADLSCEDPEQAAAAIARVTSYVDLAERLGIRRMRHDVVRHAGVEGDDTPLFEQVLPRIVASAQEIARYAAPKGITTSLENHGFFVQSADRVRRIVHAVDEPNFRTTLDVGNFVCVDESPAASVAQNLPLAMVVHLKDFYIRPAAADPGEGWFRSRGGAHLRGAVVGCGDLDLAAICRSIRDLDFAGFVAIEFEGWEDPLLGCSRGLANARRLLGI